MRETGGQASGPGGTRGRRWGPIGRLIGAEREHVDEYGGMVML